MNTRQLQQMFRSQNQSSNQRRHRFGKGWRACTASLPHVERLEERTLLAGVVEADDPVFGSGALTRDTDQGLDFLDITFSIGRSFDDVSDEFGPEGDFAGFRYALQSEMISLVNNFGFSPVVTAGRLVTGNTRSDQLSGLVDLLGQQPECGGCPNNSRVSGRLTGTFVGNNVRVVELHDALDPNANDAVWTFGSQVTSFADFEPGSFLVRATPTATVTVAGQYIFYNDSFFDFDSDPTTTPFGSGDPAANANDDHAIASDKTPLLPGGTGGFANYTSYSDGINGIMVDIDGLPGTPTSSFAWATTTMRPTGLLHRFPAA